MASTGHDHRLGLGERRAAADAQLGAALVRAVDTAAGGVVDVAQAAHERPCYRRLPDRRLGAGLGAVLERDRLPPRKDVPRTSAPALRPRALELTVPGADQVLRMSSTRHGTSRSRISGSPLSRVRSRARAVAIAKQSASAIGVIAFRRAVSTINAVPGRSS